MLVGFRSLEEHCSIVISGGVSSYSLLHAVDYLLHKICIVALKFRIFKCDICSFAKFLMRATEVGLEVFPSFLKFCRLQLVALVCDVILETPRFVGVR